MRLAPERAKVHTKIVGFGPMKVAEPPAGVAAAAMMKTPELGDASTRVTRRRSVGAYQSHCHMEERDKERHAVNKPRTPCELCMLFPDRKGHANSHTLSTCFANPLNKACKPGVARMRM